MGLPKITFNVSTTGLGLLTATVEKIPGLVITGTSVADKITIGESKQLFSLDDAVALGISETENPFAYKHVKAFYDYAGMGSELWVMLVSDATTMEQMADNTQNYAKKLLNDAGGSIRVLGLIKKSTGAEVSANGLDADVDATAIKLQQLAEEFAEKYFPFRAIISGNNFTGITQDFKDYSTSNYNRVAIVLANNDGEKEASIGLALGRLSSIPVQRKISRVRDGAVEDIAAYFTDGSIVETHSSSWDNIADKRYVFLRNFANRAGFYFSADSTLTVETDDFKTLSNGFVMDKAVIIAYNVLIENLSDEIPISANGTIHPAIIKSWQNAVETNINGQMTANRELSNCVVYIDETQDVLTTQKMIVQIQLQPVGYAEFITVNIGFTTTINA